MSALDTLANEMGKALTKVHVAHETLARSKDPKTRRDATRIIIKFGKIHQELRRQYEKAKRIQNFREAAE